MANLRRLILTIAAMAVSATAYAQYSGGSYSNVTIVAPVLSGATNASGAVFTGATPFCFEGATADAYETCFSITDVTSADKTVTFQNASGTVAYLTDLASMSGSSLSVGVTASHDRILLGVTAKGAGQFDGTIQAPDLTGTRTWTLPDGSGTIAVTTDFTGGSIALAGSSLTAGVTGTNDRIIITPLTKGSNQYDGTITSVDLTAARAYTLPDLSGTVALMGPSNSGTFYATTLSGTLSGHVLDAVFETPVNAKPATATMGYDNGTNFVGITLASYAFTYTDANIPASNDTITVTDGVTPKTYKFVASVADEGDVLLTADPDTTMANFVCALNDTGCTENTDYKAATYNPLVSATSDSAGAGTGTLTVTSRMRGTLGNSYALDGTFAGLAFIPDHALESGVAGDTVDVNGTTYTFAVAVLFNNDVKVGASADESAAHLACAVNDTGCTEGAGQDFMATLANTYATAAASGDDDTVVFTAVTNGVAGNSYTLTEVSSTAAVTDAWSNTPAGVDGTLGAKGDLRFDASYIYFCTAANGISGANWGRAALTVGY